MLSTLLTYPSLSSTHPARSAVHPSAGAAPLMPTARLLVSLAPGTGVEPRIRSAKKFCGVRVGVLPLLVLAGLATQFQNTNTNK